MEEGTKVSVILTFLSLLSVSPTEVPLPFPLFEVAVGAQDSIPIWTIGPQGAGIDLFGAPKFLALPGSIPIDVVQL